MTPTFHFIDPWRNRSNHIACPNTLAIRMESTRIHITLLILYLGPGKFLIHGWQSSPWLCFEILSEADKVGQISSNSFQIDLFSGTMSYIQFFTFIDTELVGIFEIFAITQYHPLMLHRHYHGCRWPGSKRSLSINNNNCFDPRLPEYHSFSTKKQCISYKLLGLYTM